MIKIFLDGIDKSIKLRDFNQAIDYSATNAGSIEIGYYKPISDLFIDFKEFNLTEETISLYYFAPTQTQIDLTDETENFTKSGFLSWDRTAIEPVKTTRNGHELYWYKMEFSGDFEVQMTGLDLVFSNDNDLVDEYPTIMDNLPQGEISFIRFHKAARDKILTEINNLNIRKVTNIYNRRRINQFDIMDINEIRAVSKYTTIGLIYKSLSDAVDDKWSVESKANLSLASALIEMPNLSIDINDNGLKDEYQNASMVEILKRQ